MNSISLAVLCGVAAYCLMILWRCWQLTRDPRRFK